MMSEMCKGRNLPPKPKLKRCKCGNHALEIRSWTIIAEYFVACPECHRATKMFCDSKKNHGVIRAALAWNHGHTYLPVETLTT